MLTNEVLMVRPCRFGFNPETAESNAFQRPVEGDTQSLALAEFDAVVSVLRTAGITVHILEDTPQPPKPDALFPNNWFSMHPHGTLVLYPMLSSFRRSEVREDALLQMFPHIQRTIDLSLYASADRFLEGTGSLIFDHESRIAFAAESPRTNAGLAQELCAKLGYELVLFSATYAGQPIYHTNVVLSLGEGIAILATETLDPQQQRREIVERLAQSDREVLEISKAQMGCFGANVLALKDCHGNQVFVISQTGLDSMSDEQVKRLRHFGATIPLKIPTIETVGGGSARCMLAEIW
ncbi:MAG: amidinotransferase [Armatimonadetes bacterium]|nr:amidinotransferase [Armatimonadota bacterium]